MFDGCQALVLNADFRPLSYFPLSLWSWQEAVKAVVSERVHVVSHYDRVVHSPTCSLNLPSVIARNGAPNGLTHFLGTYMHNQAFVAQNVDYGSTISVIIVLMGVAGVGPSYEFHDQGGSTAPAGYGGSGGDAGVGHGVFHAQGGQGLPEARPRVAGGRGGRIGIGGKLGMRTVHGTAGNIAASAPPASGRLRNPPGRVSRTTRR